MTPETLPALTRLSPQDFAALGVNQVAFVKPIQVEGRTAYGVHAADGTPLTVVANRDVAFALVRQNEMEPVSAH